MAFSVRHLSVLAYANGFTLWHYKAPTEVLETIAAKDFFADAADMMTTGDIVMVSASDGARILAVASPGGTQLTTLPLVA
jgi:hypothetical protein